jgi:exodeoxyribonuclease V alpha subunit
MTAQQLELPIASAPRRPTAKDGTHGPGRFEALRREIESGAQTLNLGPGSVDLAAEIASLEPDLDHDQRVALILLVVVSLAALEEGSTRLPVTGPQAREPMHRLLAALVGDSRAELSTNSIGELLRSGAACGVIGRDPNDYKPLLYLPPFIYQQRLRAAEEEIAERLAQLIRERDAHAVDEARLQAALADLTARPSVADGRALTLSDEQCAAVAAAFRARLTVISGGPGTGKTSIVFAIVRLLLRMGVACERVALAAPTAKAAYRMSECIREGLAQVRDREANDATLADNCPQATTIHRLLDYSPGRARFRHHHNNPLSASVVIIDEGSMLDLVLMERLLDAIPPGARLIVLGDADQLPSVTAGAVFRDLMSIADNDRAAASGTLAGACVRLSHTYRLNTSDAAGRSIAMLARAINDGVADAIQARADDGTPVVAQRASAAEIAFAGAEYLPDPAGSTAAFLARWYDERVHGDAEIRELATRVYTLAENGFAPQDCERLRKLFAHRAAARVLCVTRVFETGADRINEQLHRLAAEEFATPAVGDHFFGGEPLVVLRNDYERMLFNGDQGIAIRVKQPGARPLEMAVFPRADNFAAFRIDALGEDLELGYATTVHKAQGSEFDGVALILPATDLPLLTREILYTAISRARKSAIVVGDEQILRLGISRKVDRYSGLSELFAARAA